MSSNQWNQMSAEAKFLGYNFIPTSLVAQRSSKHKLVLSLVIILLLFSSYAAIVGSVCLLVELDSLLRLLGIPCLLLTIAIVAASLIYIIRWYRKSPKKSDIADYIQTKRGYTLFVKNGKFGVLKNYNNKVLVPAQYDSLSWLKNKQILVAELNGETFPIDIHNNCLQ